MTDTFLPSVDLLTHVAEPMKFMVQELHAGRAPANIMKVSEIIRMGERWSEGVVDNLPPDPAILDSPLTHYLPKLDKRLKHLPAGFYSEYPHVG